MQYMQHDSLNNRIDKHTSAVHLEACLRWPVERNISDDNVAELDGH